MENKPLWEGRLSGDMEPSFAKLNASIHFDRRLWHEDIQTNRAYLEALRHTTLLTEEEYKTLKEALEKVQSDFQSGKVEFRPDLEDIHTHVETELAKHAGALAGKIHTGRSRNDQVATDLRLFVKRHTERIERQLISLVEAITGRAEAALDVIIPAYTHLQRAQPVLLSHWFLAYCEMFLRDLKRFSFAREQADSLPLGLGACTGNPFGIDRELLCGRLGFSRLCRNSLDGISDRDFVLDFLNAGSTLFIHLSRLAEDLIIWSSTEFGLVELAAEVSTGSSMMPQKRNADSLELTRGKTGRVVSNLFRVLMVLKGLPLAYNKDLQEDKEPLFDSVDTVQSTLSVVKEVISGLKVRKDACEEALRSGYLEATSVADYLTRKGVPFRTAYSTTGRIIRDVASRGRPLKDLTLNEWKEYSQLFEADIQEAIKPEAIVEARDGIGGTASSSVKREINRLYYVINTLKRKEGS